MSAQQLSQGRLLAAENSQYTHKNRHRDTYNECVCERKTLRKEKLLDDYRIFWVMIAEITVGLDNAL